MMIYLMEITYYDLLEYELKTLRFSSGDQGYCTLPSDDPANAWYEPRLRVPADYQSQIFQNGLVAGAGEGGYGTAILLNPDGYFDQFLSQAWDGKQVRLLYGDSRGSYAGFTPVMTGTMCQPESTWQYFQVKVRDYTELFDRPISQFVYMGSNNEGVGYEGNPDDMMGKTKPLLFGKCLNVTPAWVSTENMVLQVHNGRIKAIDGVYSNGEPLTLATSLGTSGDFPDPDSMSNATLSGGQYVTCLAHGMFRIEGGAQTDITADVRGCNLGGSYTDTVPGIVRRIVEAYIRRPRTNWIQKSESFLEAPWAITGGTMTEVFGQMPPIKGMRVFKLSGTGAVVNQTVAYASGMACFSKFFKGSGKVKLKVADHAGATDNVLAEFDLDTGEVLSVQTNGYAVGPQYSGTDWISDAEVFFYPDGWIRVWVAGQPKATFTAIDCSWELVEGSEVLCTGACLERYSSPAFYTGPTDMDPVTGYDPLIGPTLSEASFSALEAVGVPGPVGYYVPAGEGATASTVMSALCESVGAWWSINRDGAVVVGRFAKPTGVESPVATYTPTEILQDTMERKAAFDSKDGTPAFRVILDVQKNWTTQQKNNIASDLWLTQVKRVAWLGREWREVWAEDLNTLFAHPLACELHFTSYLSDLVVAITEAKRLLSLYKQRLDRFSFTVKFEFALAVNIGDVVRIKVPRWGLDSGANFVVVGITESHESGQATLEVLG